MCCTGGYPAGYINVYTLSIEGPFGRMNLPQIAAACFYIVYFGVGLHAGCGSAQRMYDGRGVWYGDNPCIPYETYPHDDDLVLFYPGSSVD